jgi:hypothetical protein
MAKEMASLSVIVTENYDDYRRSSYSSKQSRVKFIMTGQNRKAFMALQY